jgi:hypothetical protein
MAGKPRNHFEYVPLETRQAPLPFFRLFKEPFLNFLKDFYHPPCSTF